MPRKPAGGNGYYAVRSGRNTGVYSSWAECQQQVSGHSGAEFKRFDSPAAAQSFMNGSNEGTGYGRSGGGSGRSGYSSNSSYGSGYRSNSNYGSSSGSSSGYSSGYRSNSNSNSNSSSGYSGSNNETVVYTDGASSGNGRADAKAGYGVYFGRGDSRNVSAPLKGPRQTNQRAELKAIKTALDQMQADDPGASQPVRICTDSKYAIDSVTKWAQKWKQNDWTTASGAPVQNQDLIRPIVDHIEQRGGTVQFTHVPGHSGVDGNEQADRLAVQGARKNI